MTVVIFDNEDNRIACSLYGILNFDEKEVELETIRSHLKWDGSSYAEPYLWEKIAELQKKYPSIEWKPNPTIIWY